MYCLRAALVAASLVGSAAGASFIKGTCEMVLREAHSRADDVTHIDSVKTLQRLEEMNANTYYWLAHGQVREQGS
jgi:hypothetical protein